MTDKLGELFLQLTDSGFTGVVVDHQAEGFVGDLQPATVDHILMHNAGQEVPCGDFDFFFDDISAEVDDFHSVEKGGLDVGEAVGGGDEEDSGEVVVEPEEVVVEVAVLLRVEDLEECRRGVALEGVGLHLVDLVKDEHGIGYLGFDDFLDDTTGHGTDIGAAVATDLGFVVEAAEGYPAIGASQGLRHGTADGGLAGAGRADEAKHLGSRLQMVGGTARKDGQVFDDTFLDFLDAVMVAVEDATRPRQVIVLAGCFHPRDVEKGLKESLLDGIIGRHGLDAREFGQFLVEGIGDFLGPLFLFGTGAQGLDIALGPGVGGAGAQFLLDDVHLMAKEVFSLLPIHHLLGLAVDLATQFVESFQRAQLFEQQFEPLGIAFSGQEGVFGLRFGFDMRAGEVDEDLVTANTTKHGGELLVLKA